MCVGIICGMQHRCRQTNQITISDERWKRYQRENSIIVVRRFSVDAYANECKRIRAVLTCDNATTFMVTATMKRTLTRFRNDEMISRATDKRLNYVSATDRITNI